MINAFRIALAATGLLFACSITHRSGDYACTTNADCESGRVCSMSFCVVTGSGTIDAPGGSGSGHADAPVNPHPDAPDNNGCPPGCSSCDQGSHTCNIECGAVGAASCSQPIACPPDWTCNIDCRTNQACRAGISCTNAAACNIVCGGSGSCKNIACGDGPCNVMCIGSNSCSDNIACGNSCRCDITCTGTGDQTCQQGAIDCQEPGFSGPTCADQINGGCRSQPAQFCQSTCP